MGLAEWKWGCMHLSNHNVILTLVLYPWQKQEGTSVVIFLLEMQVYFQIKRHFLGDSVVSLTHECEVCSTVTQCTVVHTASCG